MSKSRLSSGRIKKKLGTELSSSRYDYLDISNAEPDLGAPPVDNSVLIGDLDGSRTWTDITEYAEQFKGFTGSAGPQGEIGEKGYTGSQGDLGYTGSAGADGLTGSDGASGFTGSQGEIGYTGSKGVDGQFGGASFYYIFESDAYAGTVPDGYLRLDDATTTLVTFIALADTDRFNTNISSFIQTIDDSTSDIKGYIKLTEEGNPNNFTIFAVTDEHYVHDDHFHIPVSYVSGLTSAPLDDTNVIVSFIVNGDKGDIGFTGSQGIIGFTGSQGLPGTGGTDGTTGFTGSQGLVGFTGSQGLVGFTGSQGLVGFTGSQGDLGYTGSIGFTGSKGAQIFRDLLDAPSSYANQAGRLVAVNSSETALEFVGVFPLRFLDLVDTPASYASAGGKVVSVKADGSGLEFIDTEGGGGEGGATQFVKTYFYEGLLSENVGDLKLIVHRAAVLTSVRIFIGEVGTSSILTVINRNGVSILTIEVPGNENLVVESGLNIVLSENDRITVDILQGSITSRDLYVTIVYEV